MNNFIRPTYMEVDTNAFLHNLNIIKKKVGNSVEVMPIVKANAYGTQLNLRTDILNSFNIVGVANVSEVLMLRNLGYIKDVFILNQPCKGDIPDIVNTRATVGVCEKSFVEELSKFKSEVKIHIEIETGMGRTGITYDEIDDFIKSIPSNVVVEGVYTHFSSADYDDEYTKMQIEKFKEAVSKVKEYYPDIKYIHASASDGIMFYDEAFFTLVRPGLIMYGYSPVEESRLNINLKPVAKLKSMITFLKTVESGTSIGYGRKYVADKKTKIATVPIGYADGFRRALSNKGRVYINGQYAQIVGIICMDSFMCDVTDIDCHVGDEVIIWDNENIKLEELAEECDTINYEIISCISSRVPRKYI